MRRSSPKKRSSRDHSTGSPSRGRERGERTDYGENLRGLLSEKKAVAEIVDFGANQVFEATTYTCLLFLTRQPNSKFRYAEGQASAEALANLDFSELSSGVLSSESSTFASKETSELLEKLSGNATRLLDLPAEMSRGSSSGDDEVFVIEPGSVFVEQEILRRPIFATDFNRYSFSRSSNWRIIFPYRQTDGDFQVYTEDELRKKFPKAYQYLLSHQTKLKKRKQYAKWYGYSAPRNLELHDRAQILVPLLADRGLFALIPENTRATLCPMANSGFSITLLPDCPVEPEYVLGLLNSRLLFWRLRQASNVFRGGWITCTKQYFGELPICNIDFSGPADKAQHDEMVVMVQRMLDLHKQLSAAQNPDDKTRLQREIDATDRQIDQLVYELYGLTEEEIAIVESGFRTK